MGGCGKGIGEADEVLEEREDMGVIARRWDLHRKVEALLGNGVIESANISYCLKGRSHPLTSEVDQSVDQ